MRNGSQGNLLGAAWWTKSTIVGVKRGLEKLIQAEENSEQHGDVANEIAILG